MKNFFGYDDDKGVRHWINLDFVAQVRSIMDEKVEIVLAANPDNKGSRVETLTGDSARRFMQVISLREAGDSLGAS